MSEGSEVRVVLSGEVFSGPHVSRVSRPRSRLQVGSSRRAVMFVKLRDEMSGVTE
jgi:hypothetical protein